MYAIICQARSHSRKNIPAEEIIIPTAFIFLSLLLFIIFAPSKNRAMQIRYSSKSPKPKGDSTAAVPTKAVFKRSENILFLRDNPVYRIHPFCRQESVRIFEMVAAKETAVGGKWTGVWAGQHQMSAFVNKFAFGNGVAAP